MIALLLFITFIAPVTIIAAIALMFAHQEAIGVEIAEQYNQYRPTPLRKQYKR